MQDNGRGCKGVEIHRDLHFLKWEGSVLCSCHYCTWSASSSYANKLCHHNKDRFSLELLSWQFVDLSSSAIQGPRFCHLLQCETLNPGSRKGGRAFRPGLPASSLHNQHSPAWLLGPGKGGHR